MVNADGGLIFLSAGLITFSIIADDFYANTAPATVSAVVSVVIPPFLPISLLLSPPLGDVQVNASAQIYVIARGGLPQDNLYQYSALPQGFVSVQRDGGLLFVSVGRIPFTVIADDGDGGANPATLIATVAVRGRYDIVHIGGAAITIFNNATVVRDAQVGSFFVAGEDLRGVADAVVNIAPSSLWSLRPLNPAGVFGRGFGRGFGALLITSAAMTNNYTATIIVRDSQGELLAATAYLSVHFDRSQIRAVPQVSATLGVRTLPLSLAWLFERGVGAYSITVIGAQVSANGHLVNVIAPVADVAGLQSITIIADDENADTPPLTVAHTVLRYAPELSLDIDYLRRYIERDIGFLRGLAVVRAIGGGFADGGYTLRLFARSDNAADFTIGDSVRTLTSDIVGRTVYLAARLAPDVAATLIASDSRSDTIPATMIIRATSFYANTLTLASNNDSVVLVHSAPSLSITALALGGTAPLSFAIINGGVLTSAIDGASVVSDSGVIQISATAAPDTLQMTLQVIEGGGMSATTTMTIALVPPVSISVRFQHFLQNGLITLRSTLVSVEFYPRIRTFGG